MTETLLSIHRYVALIISLILLVVCITGCLLVFELRMDRWLDPGVAYVAPQAASVPVSQILANLKKQFPEGKVTEMNPGSETNESWLTKVVLPTGVVLRVFVNGYTGEVLGTRTGEPPSFWVRHVHRELIGGKYGALIVNVTSLLLVFQSLSGIYLWWPLKRATVKTSGSWTRINFDLHHAVGFFSSLFVCAIAITGVVKAYGDQLQPFFDRVTNSPTMTRALSSKQLGHAPPVGIDRALAVAQAQLPGASIGRIQPPKGKEGSYLITMKYPGDSTAPGRSWVVVDQYSGEALSSLDSRTAPLGSRIPIVNRSIHVGGLFGVPTRILAFLTSVAVLIQTITGFLMWWRKRRIEVRE